MIADRHTAALTMIVACGSLWRSPGSIRIDRCALLMSLKVRSISIIANKHFLLYCFLVAVPERAGELAPWAGCLGAEFFRRRFRERYSVW